MAKGWGISTAKAANTATTYQHSPSPINRSRQMKQFSNQKGFKEATAKVKEQFADLQANPEKMAALNDQVGVKTERRLVNPLSPRCALPSVVPSLSLSLSPSLSLSLSLRPPSFFAHAHAYHRNECLSLHPPFALSSPVRAPQVESFLQGAKAAREEAAMEGATDARSRARSAAAAKDFGMNLPGAKVPI